MKQTIRLLINILMKQYNLKKKKEKNPTISMYMNQHNLKKSMQYKQIINKIIKFLMKWAKNKQWN